HEQPERPLRVHRQPRRRYRCRGGERRDGLFTNYGEIGTRSLTKWRALAMDAFVQDSWKPADKLTIEGGVRYVLWPPWHAGLNNAALFDPAFSDPATAVTVDPTGGFIVRGHS